MNWSKSHREMEWREWDRKWKKKKQMRWNRLCVWSERGEEKQQISQWYDTNEKYRCRAGTIINDYQVLLVTLLTQIQFASATLSARWTLKVETSCVKRTESLCQRQIWGEWKERHGKSGKRPKRERINDWKKRTNEICGQTRSAKTTTTTINRFADAKCVE